MNEIAGVIVLLFAIFGFGGLCVCLFWTVNYAKRLHEMLEWFEADEPEDEPGDDPPIYFPPGIKSVSSMKNIKDDDFENRRRQGALIRKLNRQPSSTKKPPVTDKPFWDDLAALEAERENLENGNSEAGVFDALDHTRAVHERIAELKELDAPLKAA